MAPRQRMDDMNKPETPETPQHRGRPDSKAGPIALFLQVLRFYSRLPVPPLGFEPAPHARPDLRRGFWAVPLVGAVIGAIGAGAGGLAYLAGLSTAVAAALAVAAQVIAAGAFHEDGLADCCDGFWGGATPERRREIMKDSRIGTYGASALALALALRILALTELFRLIGPGAILVLVAVGALSRPLALLPVAVIAPAPGPGMAAETPMPGGLALVLGCGIGFALFAGLAMQAGLSAGIGPAILAALALVALVARLAEKKIGGHTGDVLGAGQQLAEIGLLLALSAAANWQGPL
ncbi:adenosylcobinamide-GDP ribazoletransferase [Rhabdaerophilum calidifontis]|uniref:adenosylcobinamide-GDP ribazoletransferase n=1 Tax=Rhabdaerophilum calidifontis TaxID=2604328 RepID=UPI0014083BAE|nr:adenosylcobinamide-GDP ribazoletransferase [Rhabdaerophilum calidifontis]